MSFTDDIHGLVTSTVDEVRDKASELTDSALSAISDINNAYTDLVTAMSAVDYDAGTDGISLSYTPPDLPDEPDYSTGWPTAPDEPDYSSGWPTAPEEPDLSAGWPTAPTEPDYSDIWPDAPIVPDASTVAIGDTEWARIYSLAEADAAAMSAGEVIASAQEAALRGSAVPAEVLAIWAGEVTQRTNDKLLGIRISNVVEHAKAAREDIKDLAKLQIEVYQAESANLSSQLGATAQIMQARASVYASEVNSMASQLSSTSQLLGARTGLYSAQVQSQAAELESTARMLTARAGVFSSEVNSMAAKLSATSQMLNARVGLYSAQVQGQGEVRMNKVADIQRLQEEAAKLTDFMLKRTEMVQSRSIDINKSIAELLAGITQAYLSALSTRMGEDMSISLNGGDPIWTA